MLICSLNQQILAAESTHFPRFKPSTNIFWKHVKRGLIIESTSLARVSFFVAYSSILHKYGIMHYNACEKTGSSQGKSCAFSSRNNYYSSDATLSQRIDSKWMFASCQPKSNTLLGSQTTIISLSQNMPLWWLLSLSWHVRTLKPKLASWGHGTFRHCKYAFLNRLAVGQAQLNPSTWNLTSPSWVLVHLS